MNPLKDLCKIDYYYNPDFAGIYGHKDPTDPTCVKSRTGYVITFADCPQLCQRRLQTKTACSTMDAEIISCIQQEGNISNH